MSGFAALSPSNSESSTMIDTINAHNGFQGIWPALLTPLDAHGNIDHAKFAAHAKDLLQAGCKGVTPFGTTGEGPSFTLQERMDALDQLIKSGIAPERIMLSTSCAALGDVVTLTRHAVAHGVHGCLMLPPFFFKGVSDEGVFNAYTQVIDAVAQPSWRLYLYHIPQVAGVGLSHDVIAQLIARYPHIIAGIKDSGCERAFSVSLAQAFMPDITVYVGNEPDLPTMGRLGSTGAISGLANFLPKLVHRSVLAPDGVSHAADAQRIQAMLDLLKPFALLPALKGVMSVLHNDEAWLRVRAPLVALPPAQLALLKQSLQGFAVNPQTD